MEKSEFKKRIEEQHEIPGPYLFKFIAPKGKEKQVIDLFKKGEVVQRASKNGNYISLTVNKEIQSSEEVVEIYEKVYMIKGIISL